MPIGMSFFGFLASWAAVETASKPIKAKKTTAAPRKDSTPAVIEEGQIGVWCPVGLNCRLGVGRDDIGRVVGRL